jgi:hypothetical protein
MTSTNSLQTKFDNYTDTYQDAPKHPQLLLTRGGRLDFFSFL